MLVTEDLGIAGLSIYQDDELYRFTSDSVLLSRFASVKPGEVVADLCSGSGIVGFHLYGLNAEKIKSVTFFEMQKPLYDLSVASIKKNALEDRFFAVNTRVQDIDKSYYGKFSLCVCNPPYMAVDSGAHDKSETVAICKREIALNVTELAKSLAAVLKYGGRACLVHRADRLTDVICALCAAGLEPKRLQFVLAAKPEPYLFMIEAVKGGKSGLKVLGNIKN